jgi:hypothetical protein
MQDLAAVATESTVIPDTDNTVSPATNNTDFTGASLSLCRPPQWYPCHPWLKSRWLRGAPDRWYVAADARGDLTTGGVVTAPPVASCSTERR